MEAANRRLTLVRNQLAASDGTLTVTDNRTGKSYQLDVRDNSIKAAELFKIKHEGVGVRSYDPGYLNTINCTSRISFIDGDKGILEYRGIPIEVLAERSTFLEVAFLLIFGELPSARQLRKWEDKVLKHTFVHVDIMKMNQFFRYDAHPMGQLVSTLAALSTFHPEANPALAGQEVYRNKKLRNKQIYRILGTMPTLAAVSFRHRIGRDPNKPATNMGYVENFLYMLDRLNETNYRSHPKLVRALEVLFILHAEHELNCSTAAIRHLASSSVDVYTSIAGAAAALYGPRHGGANEAVLRMLEGIGKKENIPQFIEDVKNRKAKLMGFGHRVYKNYDPRAKIVRKIADDVFEVIGREPLIEIAMELEKVALNDPYFKDRKLYPNVDFYTGVIYKAMGFPTDMFPVLFTIPRTAGWLAHWKEFLDDPENRIVRPRQNYKGARRADYVPISERQEHPVGLDAITTGTLKRRNVAVISQ